ncbi:AraC family transcriptional regulator [Paenibacillus koleovorans]|uniref:AraC family transcriptional regulator n=1 Tax=Paenibacillus koleovorans TaxID=121608 RepID=UPI0013E2C825|nr:AraC family transcriptional regulator [Paenibacillus koleovorans]
MNQELQPRIRYTDLLYFRQWRTAPRIVTDYMLIYLQEGSMELTVNGEKYRLKQGQFCFVQPGIVHQVESEADITILSLHLDLFPNTAAKGEEDPLIVTLEQGAAPLTANIQPSLAAYADIHMPVVLQPARSEWMVKTMAQAIEHWNRKNALDLLQANVKAAEIMLELLHQYRTSESSEHKASADLQWVPAYMQYRLAESLTVGQIAHKALMSKSYFSMRFREQFGLSPHQFLLKLRLDYATELLQGTSIPLQDISDSCGFSSVHHFSKMYKIHRGCPPSRVRSQ